MLTKRLQGSILINVDEMTTRTKKGAKMVDTQLLEEQIEKSGKKRGYLAEKCGCSIQALRLKIKGEYEFTNTQTDILCAELGITSLTMKEKIFFKK